MKQFSIFLPAFLLVLQTAFSQGKALPSSQYFIGLLQNKFEWMLQKDTAQLKNLLHDSLVYIHSSGMQDSKPSLLKNLFSSKNPYKKFTTAKEKVRFLNANTVIVHAELAVDYAIDETKNSLLLITEFYIKEKKRWWLISRHANKLSK
jgi:Domain of unknown function (DUF4440)